MELEAHLERECFLYNVFIPRIVNVRFAPLSTIKLVILLISVSKCPTILSESGLHTFIGNMLYGLSSSCVHFNNFLFWGFQFVLDTWKPITAAVKTRLFFDTSSNFCLGYYEIFIPLFALSLNL